MRRSGLDLGAHHKPNTGNMANILVVDDELGIRDLLSEILFDEGHQVELAENAAQAREARQRMRPDLVLLDIWMPDTDGVSLLKEWAATGLLNMPVIMMSGHATIDTAVEAVRIGAQAFLEKPITLQKLLKAVEQGLAREAAGKIAAAIPAPGQIQAAVVAVSADRSAGATVSERFFAARKVHPQLLELAVEVGALEPRFFGHPGHGAAFLLQVELEIGFFERVARLAQGFVEVKLLGFSGCGHTRPLARQRGA